MTGEQLRDICLALPNATEDIKYGSDLCFSIGGKIFCGTRIDGPFRTGIKCNTDDFAVLTERQGINPMPRLAVTGWVKIENGQALNLDEWEIYVKKSYYLVIQKLTKKERQSTGIL